jgi:phosphate transport system substrate-binding protein
MVKGTRGGGGYVEVGHARKVGLAVAWVKGAGDKYVEPTPEAVTTAAQKYCVQQGSELRGDLRFTITNVKGDEAYPICSVTYAVLPKKHPGTDRGQLVAFLRWAVGADGQRVIAGSSFAPLPPLLAEKVATVIDKIDPKP